MVEVKQEDQKLLDAVRQQLRESAKDQADVMKWLSETRPDLDADKLLFVYLHLREAFSLVPTGELHSGFVRSGCGHGFRYTPHGFVR